MHFVIRNPKEGYYTEMYIAGSKPILAPMDMALHRDAPPVKKGEQIGTEYTYRPLFEALKPRQATHLHTRKDAEDLMANEEYGAPQAFAGCVVEEVPDVFDN